MITELIASVERLSTREDLRKLAKHNPLEKFELHTARMLADDVLEGLRPDNSDSVLAFLRECHVEDTTEHYSENQRRTISVTSQVYRPRASAQVREACKLLHTRLNQE